MIKNKKTKLITFALLSIALTAFIFANSLKNGEESGLQSDVIVDAVIRFLDFFGIKLDIYTLGVIIRKLAHFTEYFLLGITATVFITSFENKKVYPIAPTYCLLVAVCDEFIMQMSTEGRAPMWSDVLIDLSGALTAFLLVILWAKKENRK